MTITQDGVSLPIDLVGRMERFAVYRCYSDLGELLYVGETGELGTRLASHAQKLWFVQVRGITLEWYADELDALKAERRAIHVEHPKYNKVHRQTTSVQVAKRKPAKRKAKGPRLDTETAKAEALAILANEPRITGAQLAARVGRSERWGQDFKSKLTTIPAQPSEETS